MRPQTKWIRHAFVGSACLTLGLWACQKVDDSEVDQPTVRETVDLPLQNLDAHVIPIQQIFREHIAQKTVVPEQAVYTDIFKQQDVIPPAIDILVIIDNSYSMEEEQLNLSDKLTSLLADLNEVDWQINVITTDNVCKRIPELPLLPDTPGMTALFQKAVRAGIDGSGYEEGLGNTIDHVNKRCTSDEAWLRDGTDLAILIVSDEDEDESSSYFEQAEKFETDLAGYGYRVGENVKMYGIIGHPDKPCPSVSRIGNTYAEVIKDSEGLWGSICDADYGPTLEAISRDIRLNLKNDFPLRFAPVISTIRIELDGNAYVGDWTVVGQRVILAETLPEGSTLQVHYQVESFRLIHLGLDSSEFVLERIKFNGEILDPSEYQYDAVSNTVMLTFDPQSGDLIETFLVENTPLISAFPFPDVEPQYVACYIANKAVESKIEVERKVISFDPPPPEGKEAHCLYTL